MERCKRTHCMACKLAWLESSGFLPVGTPKNPCVCSSCWQQTATSPMHCGCLSDYPQLPRHLWTDAAVRNGFYEGVNWILWMTFWAFTIIVLFRIQLTNYRFTDSCWYGRFILVLVHGNVPKICPHLTVTPCRVLILPASLNNQLKKHFLYIEWLNVMTFERYWLYRKILGENEWGNVALSDKLYGIRL
jgi:hypothetical protein